MVVGLKALHHGLCIFKQLNDSHEKWRADNVEEAKLGSGHAACKYTAQDSSEAHAENNLRRVNYCHHGQHAAHQVKVNSMHGKALGHCSSNTRYALCDSFSDARQID